MQMNLAVIRVCDCLGTFDDFEPIAKIDIDIKVRENKCLSILE